MGLYGFNSVQTGKQSQRLILFVKGRKGEKCFGRNLEIAHQEWKKLSDTGISEGSVVYQRTLLVGIWLAPQWFLYETTGELFCEAPWRNIICLWWMKPQPPMPKSWGKKLLECYIQDPFYTSSFLNLPKISSRHSRTLGSKFQFPTFTRLKKFQFPSNGKIYPKGINTFSYTTKGKFQFPSNGKVYPKPVTCFFTATGGSLVSIPFKRESLSKAIKFEDGTIINLFQFPSNGKVYPKHVELLHELGHEPRFQFPSNGKVYPKPAKRGDRKIYLEVSIPFKRESLSKVGTNDCHYTNKDEFQFPSNGKVYPKL